MSTTSPGTAAVASPPEVEAPTSSASGRNVLGIRRRRASLSPWRRWGEPALVIIAALGLWQSLSATGLVSSNDLPGVDQIARAFFVDLGNHELWYSIGQSLSQWLIGMAIVLVVTIPVGLLLGIVWSLFEATRLTFEFLRTIPSVAAIPLLVFVYGVTPKLTIVLVILTAVWPLLIQTMTGAHDVDPVAVDTAKIYGLSGFQIFRQVILPSALPSIMTGVKLAANIGLIFAIAASLVIGGNGLGHLIDAASNAARTPLVFSRVLVTGLLGLAVSMLVVQVERRVLPWHVSQRLPQ